MGWGNNGEGSGQSSTVLCNPGTQQLVPTVLCQGGGKNPETFACGVCIHILRLWRVYTYGRPSVAILTVASLQDSHISTPDLDEKVTHVV